MSIQQTLKETSAFTLSLWFGAVGGALGLVLMAMLEGWVSVPIGMGIGVYVALLTAYHYVRKDRDDAREEIARLKAGKANPAIVNALLEKHEYGCHHLANPLKRMTDPDQLAQWKIDCRAWERETRDLMKRLGCTPQEISLFWTFTEADLKKYPTLHNKSLINARLAWVQIRVDGLRRIINYYSDVPVFRE
jgi:hypothetical protein